MIQLVNINGSKYECFLNFVKSLIRPATDPLSWILCKINSDISMTFYLIRHFLVLLMNYIVARCDICYINRRVKLKGIQHPLNDGTIMHSFQADVEA